MTSGWNSLTCGLATTAQSRNNLCYAKYSPHRQSARRLDPAAAYRPLLPGRSRGTSPKSRPPRRTPKSSMPGRNASPTSCRRPTFSAAIRKCPCRGTKWSAEAGCGGFNPRPPGSTIASCRRVVESDITVTSASGVLANQVADHTMALLTGAAAQPADVLPRPAKARVHPPPDARPARRPHRHHRPGPQRPPAGRSAQRVSHDDPGDRLVSGEQAGARRRAAAGRRRRRHPAAHRHPHPGRAAHRPHPRHDRRPPPRAVAARRDRDQRRPRPAGRRKTIWSPRSNRATSAAPASTSPTPSRCRPKAACGTCPT